MQLDDHKPKVEAVFKERWPNGMDNSDRELTERVSIAKMLWEGESKEVQDAIVERLNEDFAAAVKRYEGVADAVENPDAASVDL